MNELTEKTEQQNQREEFAIYDPASFEHMLKIAEVLVHSSMLPAHLRGRMKGGQMVEQYTIERQKSTAFLIANAARIFQADPFQFSQETFCVHGKLDFNGKFYAGLANKRAGLVRRLEYRWDGVGDERTCTCSGTFAGETEPRELTTPPIAACRVDRAGKPRDAWKGCDPDQQLSYAAARMWVRRYCPEILLGIASDVDDIEEPAEEPAGDDLEVAKPIKCLEDSTAFSVFKTAIADANTKEELLTIKDQMELATSLEAAEREQLKVLGNEKYRTLSDDKPAEWEMAIGDAEAIIDGTNDPDQIATIVADLATVEGMPADELSRIGKIADTRRAELIG